MFNLIILFGILSVLFWLGFKVTGALFAALLWLFFKLPLALCLICLGLLCFVTILFIPLGKGCFHLANILVFP